MYGPIVNEKRGKRPEEIDTTVVSAELSTHSDGSRSGLPLWGSKRSFGPPSSRQELIQGRVSPVLRDDQTASTFERTTTPGTLNERDSFGYVELLGWLPTMQDNAVLVCAGSLEEQMYQSEHQFTQTLMRQPEQKNTLELTNYAILIHQYHHDLHRAAVILEQALYGEPTCIEALIAYGNVLFEMAEAVQKDPRKKGERNMMYDRAIKWGNRKAEHPNCYDFLTKLQHKLTPVANKGCIQLGKRLQHLESMVIAGDLKAMGAEKFGGGASPSKSSTPAV